VSIADIDVARLPRHVRRLAQELQDVLSRGSTAEAEQHKDVWDIGVFGHGRKRLDFTVIVELWLRDAAKLWVLEELPLRRGPNVVGVLSLGNDVSRAKSFNPHRFLPHTWEWSEAPVQAQPICETHYALPVHQVRAGSRPDRRTRDGISTPCVISDARDRAGRRPPGDNGWLTRCMMCEGRVRRPAPDSCVAGGEG
jgi:hypothetical protein